jgi:hypothetical protein
MAKRTKAPVSKAALMARINRKLSRTNQRLKAARGDRQRLDLGDYYVINVNRNWIVSKGIDLEEYARELDVLQPWEALTSEGGLRR